MYYYVAGGASACYNEAMVGFGEYENYACHASFRFLNFPGSSREITLTSAKLYFHAYQTCTPTGTATIYCDKAVNPTLGTGSGASGCDPRDRTLTTASVNWVLPSMGVGDHFYSADLKTPLLEVISQATFTTGNAVLIAILGSTSGEGVWVASLEHPTGDPAQLILEYTFRQQGGML